MSPSAAVAQYQTLDTNIIVVSRSIDRSIGVGLFMGRVDDIYKYIILLALSFKVRMQ